MLHHQFNNLRLALHQQYKDETKSRLQHNPIPTDEECRIGRFWELLEPQVRDVIFSLNRKGYLTEQSGFMSSNPCQQFVTVELDEDCAIRRTLEGLQFIVMPNPFKIHEANFFTYVAFVAPVAELKYLKLMWGCLDNLFPDKGQPAPKSVEPFARMFRIRHASDRYPEELSELQEEAKNNKYAAFVLRHIKKKEP